MKRARRGHTCDGPSCTSWSAEPSNGRGQAARSQFARTFADVLAGRFGGSWSVDWDGANGAALPPRRDGRAFAGKE